MATKENLLLLLQNPTEPVYYPKGDKKAVFDITTDYIAPRYQHVGVQLFDRVGEEAGERIPVKQISLPRLGNILKLPRQANFSLFIPFHREIAGQLIDIFMGMRDIEDLQSMAVYARDRVNPYLFNYCLSVALLHRVDTQGLDIPSFMESFPDKFIDTQILSQVREEANLVPTGSRTPIEIPIDYTASNLEEEHRLAYFREDIGINLHHWHWHLVYPFNGPRQIVNKNRRGELFYYMHQQVIARYNFERLCASLKRVTRFIDWRKPIPEAYFPKLDSLIASRSYPSRVANQTIQDLNREQDQVKADINRLEQWRDRIATVIASGNAQDEAGNDIPLTEFEGIDVLGNMIESSILSPNRAFYGDLHNFGHVFIAYIHDPDHRHLESFGVMGDSTTAMRDPIFYRWHAFIDDIFQQFKASLPRYTVSQINYDGVTVDSCQIQSQGGNPNVISTFWQQSDVDLTRGMDFQPRGPVFVRFTHLQHQPFTYNISVNNSGGARRGTCRIFIAPATDERGNPWLFQDQRTLFVELDRFVVNLQPGKNTIVRRSDQSSVTIPFERTFRNLEANRPAEGTDAVEQFNFCGCGWPHHLLIPKGTPEGKDSHLFVMISNYDDDRVDQDTNVPCNDASSYCGIKDRLYPDRRSMGYPFDRSPRDGVSTLQQFLTPNMRVQNVTIRFTNRTLRKPRQ
ncbi:hypothetical protein PPYR_02915 [Photinus pyralis]|uniref:Tyrosinase copper-binding domain-containing protein n=2 Tax=Photinus pyralis TaxID=7054 RepID=A0A5N4A1B7_PHOPY|nr:phenoloxidase 1-like [Photinus pyralis]KAB0791115.1 hypothetical protein PPYR_02915 [Photinus pyralis]